MTDLLKKAMEAVFDKKQKPAMFLSNFYEKRLLSGIKVELQGRSVKAYYSIDVKIGTGGRRVDMSTYDKSEFVIPEYNDYATLTEEDVLKVDFGETEYETKTANVVKMITDRQETISNNIRRAEEKQASDALFNGSITLSDSTVIDFNKKETHSITPDSGAEWNTSSGDPISDIADGCKLIIEDGKISESEFNLILDDEALSALLGNENFRSNSNILNGIKRADINIPVEKTPGAMFHGQFSCGSYRVNLWSYNEKYTIPEGFNFANEGSLVGFIPSASGVLLPMKPNFRRYYGAINNIAAPATVLGGARLQLVKGEQIPYAYDKVNGGSAVTEAGVKSRVLLVPYGVDEFVTYSSVNAS